MVATFNETVVAIDTKLSKRIQVGDTLNVEVTIMNVYPHIRVLRTFCVMTVDRINELVACRLLNEKEV